MQRPERDTAAFHVFQIALGVAMCVFVVALYVRPSRTQTVNSVREVHTAETVYVVTYKYLSLGNKFEEAK